MDYFFKTPFATSGAVAVIPRPIEGDGSVSFTEGWGSDYELDPATDPDAKRIPRLESNWLSLVITQAIREWQTRGVPEYIPTSLNDGAPYPYEINAMVRWTDGNIYLSKANSNTADPSDATKWAPFDLGSTTALLKANNLSDITNATTARTNLGLGSAAVQPASYFVQAAAAQITGGGLTMVGNVRSNLVTAGATVINVGAGAYHQRSISGAAGFTFSGVGTGVQGVMLELTISGSPPKPTWPGNVKWTYGESPDLGNGTHILGFVTPDSGTTWNAWVIARNLA